MNARGVLVGSSTPVFLVMAVVSLWDITPEDGNDVVCEFQKSRSATVGVVLVGMNFSDVAPDVILR